MDYSKIVKIDEYDFSKIKDLPDYEKRVQLIKSWLGQRNFCIAKAIPRAQRRIDTNRRVKRNQTLCIEHWAELAKTWENKIQLCLEGYPLEEIKGKLKTKTSMPPSKRKKKK